MKYCRKCILPDTRPGLRIGPDGVCSGCEGHREKTTVIDWVARAEAFRAVVERAKDRSKGYDCVIPVSGGKDSISQVHRVLGRGLRILALNVDYGVKTDIGRRNLACIPRMGASLMVHTPAQPRHRELIRLGFEEYGDPDLLSHTMLHAYPLRIAMRLEIPLLLHGENAAFEYSGEGGASAGQQMNRAWFDKYAANAGNTPRSGVNAKATRALTSSFSRAARSLSRAPSGSMGLASLNRPAAPSVPWVFLR